MSCLTVILAPLHSDEQTGKDLNEYTSMHEIDVSNYEDPLRVGDNDNAPWYLWRIRNGWG